MLIIMMAMVFGLVIGSFLNVCIYRIPEGQSINLPRSHCRWCQHTLGPLDLVPVLSYVCLGGKCRYCGEKISGQYAFVELLNSVLYGIAIYHFGLTVQGVMMCVLLSGMLVLTYIDKRYMLLPTSIILTVTLIGLVLRLVGAYTMGTWVFLMEGIVGAAVGYGILAIIYYVALWVMKQEGMGYGDVRYLGMIGLFTSWEQVLLALFLAAVVGAVYGVILLRRTQKSEAFPFGPFLSIGAILSIFCGERLITWYISQFIV